MRYAIFGPYKLPSRNDHVVIPKTFWKEIDDAIADKYGEFRLLSKACGCYVFAIRSGGGLIPWYVGKTQRQFRNECFTNHKRAIINNILNYHDIGTLLLYLCARMTDGGIFSKTSGSYLDVDFLENMLIGYALSRNREIENKKQTKLLREMHVPFLLNPEQGRPTDAANDFARLFGLD